MVVALDRLSLDVPVGEVHGLLGPNGAGKTTLCKILSTILLPTSGSVRVLGRDVVTEAALVRPGLGIVFGGERGLYGRLTARQNLLFWAALYKVPAAAAGRRAAELLDRVGLTDKADAAVESFSRGMKQRLHLARGLIGDPGLLLLDEPTTGMDPVAAHAFRALVAELRAEGRTLLVATHDMDEAEQVCDRVTLIHHGTVLATEAPHTLAARRTRRRWVEVEDPDTDRLAVADLPGVVEIVRRPGVLRIRVDGDESARRVVDEVLRSGASSVVLAPPRLEDVYLDLIGTTGMAV